MNMQTAADLAEVMHSLGRRKTATASVKQSPTDGSGRFTAIVSTFGPPPDTQGDVVAEGAFLKSIVDWRARDARPTIWWQHDYSTPSASLGLVERMYEAEEGLVVEGVLDLTHEPAVAVYEGLLSGRLKEFSIGYAVIKEHKETSKEYGRFNVLTEVELLEISIVYSGANRFTRVLDVKSAGPDPNDPATVNKLIDEAASRSRVITDDDRKAADDFITQVRLEIVQEAVERAERASWEQRMLDTAVRNTGRIRVDARMRPNR